MLKKSALRRIMVSTLALIITSILYFFPNNNSLNNIKTTVDYISLNKSPIYLINKDNYLVRTTLATKNNDSLAKAKELIEALTIGSEKNEYIPENFKAIIPQNTKILSLNLDKELLKINFSKEFLNISKELEEKLIESLIYTLTEIDGIKEIMIFIDN